MERSNEIQEMWDEIRRTAWLVKEGDASALGAPLALAQRGMAELDLKSLSPAVHCVSDAKILARLIDDLDRLMGGDGVDASVKG